jgi:hypothetical protein
MALLQPLSADEREEREEEQQEQDKALRLAIVEQLLWGSALSSGSKGKMGILGKRGGVTRAWGVTRRAACAAVLLCMLWLLLSCT